MDFFCELHKVTVTDWCEQCEDAKVKADMRVFGNGFYRRYSDGRIEHIPAEQVHIQTRPNTQED